MRLSERLGGMGLHLCRGDGGRARSRRQYPWGHGRPAGAGLRRERSGPADTSKPPAISRQRRFPTVGTSRVAARDGPEGTAPDCPGVRCYGHRTEAGRLLPPRERAPPRARPARDRPGPPVAGAANVSPMRVAIISFLDGSRERLASDLVMLIILATLSVVPYVFRLGFYSDDWAILSMLVNSPDHSLSSLFASQYADDNMRVRPTQIVYQAVLFKAFGLRPVGYHLVNAAVLASVVLLLYSNLREIGLPRTVARAVSAVYLLLPNYSTDRFWFVTFSYVLTAALFLLGTYAALRALRSDRFVLWFAFALLALTASLLGMEVFLPFTMAIPFGLWLQRRRWSAAGLGVHPGTLQTFAFVGALLVIVASIVSYKAANAVGVMSPDLPYLVRLAAGSVAVNFGTFGLALPHTFAWSLRQLPLSALVWPCFIGTIVFLWLLRGEALPRALRFCILLGVAVCVAFSIATAIFITTRRFGFSSIGFGNRVWLAAALGAAAV